MMSIRFAVVCKQCRRMVDESVSLRTDGVDAFEDPAGYLLTMNDEDQAAIATFATEHQSHGATPAIVEMTDIANAKPTLPS